MSSRRPRKGTATSKPQGRYHHGDLRRALIATSRQIIAEQGEAALSMRGVARRLGVSHAAPLHHFADKRQLVAAVAAEGFEELRSTMQDAADQAGPGPREKLNATGVAYVRYATGHPALFRLMFGPGLPRASSPALDESSRAAFRILVDAAREAVEAPDSRIDTSELPVVTTAAWSVVHGLALLWLDGHLQSAGDAAELAHDVTLLLSRALERPADTEPPP